jgi:hypothetical protein
LDFVFSIGETEPLITSLEESAVVWRSTYQ